MTAGTLYKQHLFSAPAALDALQEMLFERARAHDVTLQAWCVFSNHYHLVAAADDGARIRKMLARLYVDSARALNLRDGAAGRKVWYQFRDTQLTWERSWLARLRYTHENAVHHGLVVDAKDYPWCSARWFAETARPSFVATFAGYERM